MEGEYRFGNSKGRQQDLTEVDVKPHKNTNVQRKSITTATRPRSDLIKKDPRSKMVTRNQGRKTSSQDIVSVLIEPDPKTYNKAMNSVKHVEWKEAADAELATLEENRTWTIVPRTNDIKSLHTKWVFKRKTDANGNLERFKARMVACGQKQVFGVNYDMTFAAVMDLGTAKHILA